ncbi:DUF2785 domain-containing protein [Alteromonas sp. H39]|uniref:DUF2785 domain-containing protein n=1 Tax=Alteromonas sp. H39 TaxID=3389876 RepID=UPI0039E064DF
MRQFHFIALVFLLTSFSVSAVPDHKYCVSQDFDEQRWQQYISTAFAESEAETTELVNRLYACLASPDPTLRDDIGYQGFSVLLRQATPSQPILLALFERLSTDIATHVNDPHKVFLPFALLVYSEVIRTDRIFPVFTNAHRQQAIDTVSSYLDKQTDYRGFSEQVGWRHGLAHAADVILQLALNPALTHSQIKQSASVLLQHISPQNAPALTDGEPYRMARAIAYLMLREEVNVNDWKDIMREHGNSAPRYPNWTDTYQSRAGLNYLHNKRAFFTSLVTQTVYQNDTRLETLTPEIAKIARSIR